MSLNIDATDPQWGSCSTCVYVVRHHWKLGKQISPDILFPAACSCEPARCSSCEMYSPQHVLGLPGSPPQLNMSSTPPKKVPVGLVPEPSQLWRSSRLTQTCLRFLSLFFHSEWGQYPRETSFRSKSTVLFFESVPRVHGNTCSYGLESDQVNRELSQPDG